MYIYIYLRISLQPYVYQKPNSLLLTPETAGVAIFQKKIRRVPWILAPVIDSARCLRNNLPRMAQDS